MQRILDYLSVVVERSLAAIRPFVSIIREILKDE